MLPASLSRGTVFSASCIPCHAPCKQGSSRCVLHLLVLNTIPIRPGTGSESPFTLHGTTRGCRFAKSEPPAKPGACVSPGRAYYRQASREARNALSFASPALRPVNGRRLSKIVFLAIVKLLISSRFARCWKRKLFTLPSRAEGCRFTKAPKTERDGGSRPSALSCTGPPKGALT